jgi:hypothetical protein
VEVFRHDVEQRMGEIGVGNRQPAGDGEEQRRGARQRHMLVSRVISDCPLAVLRACFSTCGIVRSTGRCHVSCRHHCSSSSNLVLLRN